MNRGLLLVCLLSLLGACRRAERDKPAPPPPLQGTPKANKTPKRAHEPMVYVDGTARASLTWAELPAGASGERPALCDYLREIGVACASLRELHLYREGGAVESLAADHLTGLQLAFDEQGRPRIGGATVDDVAIYVQKAPPPLPVKGIPYLDEPVRGGTRVNVDGRLAARMKRNQLDDKLTSIGDDNGEPRYALADFLATLKLGAPRAVELVTADETILRVPDAELPRVNFSAERQKHGQMSFHFGAQSASVVAVNVYLQSLPPPRAHASEPAPRAPAPANRQAGFSAGCDVAVGGRGSSLAIE